MEDVYPADILSVVRVYVILKIENKEEGLNISSPLSCYIGANVIPSITLKKASISLRNVTRIILQYLANSINTDLEIICSILSCLGNN